MKQALLYSINAEHLVNILNGLKTIEVRKRDLPQWAKDKLARGEIVDGYMYCTKKQRTIMVLKKGEEMFGDVVGKTVFVKGEIANDYNKTRFMAGHVVVKFEVSSVNHLPSEHMDWLNEESSILKYSCLTLEQLLDYGKGKDLYAHHIKNIQPVNMELMEFYKLEPEIMYNNAEGVAFKHGGYVYNKLFKAPQSFQTVWVKS